MTDFNDRQQAIELGRQLVRSGAEPADMLSLLAMCDYHRSRSEVARRYGCCGGNGVWVSPIGEVCCRDTREPCREQRLREIVRTWSSINGGKQSGERSSKSGRWGRGNRARRK